MIIEKEINGKMYGFCFNFYAFGVAEEELEMPLDKILSSLGEEEKPSKVSRIKTICVLFFAAAVSYRKHKGLTVDFNVSLVGDWIHEIGYAESMSILEKALSVFKPKNIQPPQMEGDQNQKAGE